MIETHVTLPELALIAGTRLALGIGVGLLVADRMTCEQRRGAGWALFTFGALTTIPLAIEVLGHRQRRTRRRTHREFGEFGTAAAPLQGAVGE